MHGLKMWRNYSKKSMSRWHCSRKTWPKNK